MQRFRNSVLFYPNIALKDPKLVKEALLLYDNFYRIVPRGITPDDNPEIKSLIDEYNLIKTIDPKRYNKDASKKFQTKVKRWSEISAGFSPEIIGNTTRLHRDKVYHELQNLLIEENILEIDGDWFKGNDPLIANYMIFLSNEISNQNDLALLTNSVPSWTTQEYINYDGNFGECHLTNGQYSTDTQQSLIGLYLKDYIPENIGEISISSILEFRDDNRIERRNFMNNFSKLSQGLSEIRDPVVFFDEIETLHQSMEDSLEDYRDSCRQLGPKHFIGIKAVTAPVFMEIAQSLFAIEPSILNGLMLIGIMAGGVWSLHSYIHDSDCIRKNNPYSYLDILQNYSFENMSQLNTVLAANINEFVND